LSAFKQKSDGIDHLDNKNAYRKRAYDRINRFGSYSVKMDAPKLTRRNNKPTPLSGMTMTAVRPCASGMSSITGIGFGQKKSSIPGLVVNSPVNNLRLKIAPQPTYATMTMDD
jgi:hypothetical protein